MTFGFMNLWSCFMMHCKLWSISSTQAAFQAASASKQYSTNTDYIRQTETVHQMNQPLLVSSIVKNLFLIPIERNCFTDSKSTFRFTKYQYYAMYWIYRIVLNLCLNSRFLYCPLAVHEKKFFLDKTLTRKLLISWH